MMDVELLVSTAKANQPQNRAVWYQLPIRVQFARSGQRAHPLDQRTGSKRGEAARLLLQPSLTSLATETTLLYTPKGMWNCREEP